MQLAGSQDEGLRHNHLKIHKVRDDASRCRDLCVGSVMVCPGKAESQQVERASAAIECDWYS